MGINFYSFHSDDEELDIAEQPTQPLPRKKTEDFLDRALLDQTIREARGAYILDQKRHCVLCQMVRERRTGVYEPRIPQPDLCEEHFSRLMVLTSDDPDLRSLLHAIIEHAKNHNTWPPPDHQELS